MLTIGSLFSGIGGFDLGLGRAGMRTVWFCEQDAFCQRVLARHWPGVPIHNDVRALVADTECSGRAWRSQLGGRADPVGQEAERREGSDQLAGRDQEPGDRSVSVPVPYVDVLCGGFPCQDLSYAGAGAGLAGARSGLWSEYARLIGEMGPRYVVVENVAALLARGLGTVLADLAALGYDAEWDCIPASAVGAPHRRDRIWLVAYPGGDDGGQGRARGSAASGARESEPERSLQVANAAGVGYADRASEDAHAAQGRSRRAAGEPGWWSVEPHVGRVAHGIPARVDRLRSLGNALVPQIAEWIGRRIIEHEEGRIAA